MCGIYGIVDRQGDTAVRGRCVDRLTRTLTHRRPDDDGRYGFNSIS